MERVCNIDGAHSLVKLCWNELPSIAELKKTIDGATADSDFKLGMNFLWDRKPTGASPASSQYLREALYYVQELAERIGPHSWALVGHNPTDFGKARMLEALSDGTKVTIRAFKSAGDAEEWLRNPVRYDPYRVTTPERTLAVIDPISE